MITRLRVMCGALALGILAPVAASAQPPRNPFAELFGRAPERTGREYTAVQFRSTAGVQMGQTIEEQLQTPDAVIPEGLSGGADGMLIAQYMRDRVQVQGQGRYAYQEFRREPAFGAPAFDAGVRADFKPTTRLGMQGGVHVGRSPFFQLMMLGPADPTVLTPIDRSAILLMQNDTGEVTGGITSYYTKRSSIELSGVARETRFSFMPDHNYSTVGGHVQWKRQMSRDLAVRLGYGREESRQRQPEGDLRFINELMDIGVDYTKALTLARRTSFSFGTETTMLRERAGGSHFRLNGNVRLERHFLKTWIMQVAAARATDFLPGFRAPVLSEHATAALAGYLSKRFLFNVNADGNQGEVGFHDPRKFISYGGNAKITFAVTRHLGVFTQYVYYHYQSPPDPETLFLMPRGARQAVSIGIETWVSIFDKDKVTRDPR